MHLFVPKLDITYNVNIRSARGFSVTHSVTAIVAGQLVMSFVHFPGKPDVSIEALFIWYSAFTAK